MAAVFTDHVAVNLRYLIDVILVVGSDQQRFGCIKKLLAEASPVFAKLLSSQSHQELRLPEDDSDALVYILHMLHDNEAEIFLELRPILERVNLTHAARKICND